MQIRISGISGRLTIGPVRGSPSSLPSISPHKAKDELSLMAAEPWTNYFTTLCLSLLICKGG